ncbi:MAG: glycosyltransferase [Defluviitaleaceae bacterium]|nr:glycosyltransferase [Defluviitaleaceae bacterium]
MRIVHINETDLVGARFNGHDLQIELNKKNCISHQIVFGKEGDNSNTIGLANKEDKMIREYCRQYEESLSLHALIYPFGTKIMDHEIFRKADIIHCHLIHNHFLSLYDFLEMSCRKPVVWTIHDPWAITGHCIHPLDCKGWTTGCKNCPSPEKYFTLKENTSSMLWDIKKSIYAQLDIDIVVASKWMKNMISISHLTSHFNKIHEIPLGINTDIFTDSNDKAAIRKKYKIPQNNFVIFFRSDREDENPFKGLSRIREMLNKLKNTDNITLLTVGSKGNLYKFKRRFQVIEFGWINDELMLSELYAASDTFLMPSFAESFGLMAIEAMATGLPVIVYEGTALPDVIFAPDCGIAIRDRDEQGFANAVEMLINDTDERKRRGKLARELALKHYRFEDYVSRHIDLYENVIKKGAIEG